MTFDRGYHALGFSLLNSVVERAVVQSGASSAGFGLALEPAAAQRIANHLINAPDDELFVEVVAPPVDGGGSPAAQLGHRFEIDEVASRTSLAGGVLALEGASPWTTWSGAVDLAGWKIEVVPHLTLAQLFPPDRLHGSFSFSSADQVQLLRGGEFESYYVLGDNETFAEWRRVGDIAAGSTDGLVIHPGEGLYFVRSDEAPGPIVLTFSGRVRQGPFVQPLEAGITFVAEGHPKTRTFVDRNALGGSFTGSFTFKDADQVQVPEGGGYDKFYLVSDGATFAQWVQFGGDFSSENATPVFDFRRAVFIKRMLPDPGYRLEAPWLN